MQQRRAVIAGGGAAGFFAATACAEADPSCEVIILEATARVLVKVGISGGGRCNATHACFDPRQLAAHYPRGGRELLGAFHRWQPRDTVDWFAAHGVVLKTEADGRMFPVTDDSRTIIDCLCRAAESAGVQVRLRCGLAGVVRLDPAASPARPGFRLELTTGETLDCDRLLIATGGSQASAGLTLASRLGHTIEPPVPSLFTFHLDDPRLRDLQGISVEHAEVSVPGTKLRESGPVLITHGGLSGPAILRLSAWGARGLHDCNYTFALAVNWAAPRTLEQTLAALRQARSDNPRKQTATWCPFGFSQRLWERLVAAAGVAPTAQWTSVSNAALQTLAAQLVRGEFRVTGKSLFKDEFVTCGGVRLKEIDFKTMESLRCPGLHFAGEVLDLDGLTGGYNFQAAWTTGWIAGRAMGTTPSRASALPTAKRNASGPCQVGSPLAGDGGFKIEDSREERLP